MALIKPFRGLRFQGKAGNIETLTCPPYDIIPVEKRPDYLSANDYNIIRLELPQGNDPYNQAASALTSWLNQGIVGRDKENQLYLYEQDFLAAGKKLTTRGLICRVGLAEFSEGIILPHEETLSKAKADRFDLLTATGCSFSAVYSLYFDPEKQISTLLDSISAETPDYSFTDAENVTHRFWSCGDAKIHASMQKAFKDKKLYIADGHHRYETALNYRRSLQESMTVDQNHPANHIMMLLAEIESDGLVVFPTHRLVKGIENFSPYLLMAACEEDFVVTGCSDAAALSEALSTAYEQGCKAFGFYSGSNHWYLLRLKDPQRMVSFWSNKSEAWRNLDVTILHTLILERLLGIDAANMALQKNLTYTRSFEEAQSGVQNGLYQGVFILNPTRVTEIAAVASAGEKMPQKSTYFYPKPLTGFVMNQIKDVRNGIFE